jgi:hypothetical protein
MPRALHNYSYLALLLVGLMAAPVAPAASKPVTNSTDKAKAEKAEKNVKGKDSKDGKSKSTGKSEAATNAAPVEVVIPKSNFASTLETGGKDPFFPDTLRFQQAAPKTGSSTNKVAVAPAEVKVNGFTGNPTQPLVILNNVTFGEGDDTTVPTPTGRVRVRCLEIRVAEQVAIVEVNGVRRELRFAPRK